MKERDLDKDTIVAYHAYLQNRIHNELNAVGLGPGWLPCRVAQLFGIFSLTSLITGVLVITLRHRHVYLVDWWHAFLGPFFIILGLILACLATYLVIIAKRRSNQYRRELFFRPIGDYGVAVVHKSTLIHEQEHRSDLKSGTTPHRTVMPRAEAFSSHGKEKRSHRGHENRGYMDNSHDDRRHDRDRRHDDRHRDDRRRRDDRDRDDRKRRDDRDRSDDRRRRDDRDRDDRRRRDDDKRRHPDDEKRRHPDDEKRRHPDERRDRDDHRRRDDRERRERDPEKRRPPPEDKRPPPDGDRQEKRRPDEQEKSTPSQGGRRAVRGIPKLPDSSQTTVVLDENFGKAATDESEL